MIWQPTLKQYPHFDAPVSRRRLLALVTSPNRVAENAFLPFIKFSKSWQPFRHSPKPDRKSREIRYASHRDSAIYSYYRHKLSASYEDNLAERDISDVVIAYRHLKDSDGGGKSNIHFARDAFLRIQSLGDCYVVTMDIRKYFDSIDHRGLEKVWEQLLGSSPLPHDHKAVFRSLTRYSEVDRDELYERVGLAKWVKAGSGRKLRLTKKKADLPKQICSMSEFRRTVAAKRPTGLIKINKNDYGIPQGAALSDLLANAYLMNFDVSLKSYASENGGFYYRYCDDIIVGIPTKAGISVQEIEDFTSSEITKSGPRIQISTKKTSAHRFFCNSFPPSFSHLKGKGKNGLEYLGFRFDGEVAFVRDVTLATLHRKILLAARGAAVGHVKRHPTRALKELKETFNLSEFLQRHGRIQDFDGRSKFSDRTFWTYGKGAIRVMSSLGVKIPHQLARYKKFARRTLDRELDEAYARIRS